MTKVLLLLLVFVAMAVAVASGCGRAGKPDEPTPTPKFLDVGELYCLWAERVVETCDPSAEPWTEPFEVVFVQAVSGSNVEFSGGGMNFGGLLGTNGTFSAEVLNFDQYIAKVSYAGEFTDSCDDNLADYHTTLEPTYFTITYNLGACVGGGAGESVITLQGDRAATCDSASQGTMNEILRRFRSDGH